MLAQDLYRVIREVEALEQRLEAAPLDRRAALEEKLRKAKAERDYMKRALDGKKELKHHNLELDPFERYNLIRTHPEIGNRMLGTMVRWEKEMARPPRGGWIETSLAVLWMEGSDAPPLSQWLQEFRHRRESISNSQCPRFKCGILPS